MLSDAENEVSRLYATPRQIQNFAKLAPDSVQWREENPHPHFTLLPSLTSRHSNILAIYLSSYTFFSNPNYKRILTIVPIFFPPFFLFCFFPERDIGDNVFRYSNSSEKS